MDIYSNQIEINLSNIQYIEHNVVFYILDIYVY